MKAKLLAFVVTFFVLVLVSNFSYAQEGESIKRQQKELEKKQEERAKADEKAKQEGLDRHQDIQDKDTRKRMKKNKKKSDRLNTGKKDPFYKKWFIK